ncbi:hypothetical protein OG625_23885 [Streptomyces sp. NBC_01351]|uniref:hypothetical protein n=1 Tax=Streptomyces sp. NBC_01351 TaxID=2903833 RepID=UPI002E304464|nr:hypothetical protein [Streptomyces sp. NBC_01351]
MSAAGVALMLGGAGILLAASPAQAASVTFKTECIPPSISGLPPIQGETTVEITAPATAKVGDTVDVTWKTVKAASKNPDVIDLEANMVEPSGDLKVGGAQTGVVAMKGPRENPPIPKGGDMKLSTMTGKLKIEKAGDITLTPDKYVITVHQIMKTETKCAPKEAVKASATIKVEGGSGNGGNTNGGTNNGGTNNGGTNNGGTTAGGGGQTDFPGKPVDVKFDCGETVPGGITTPVTVSAKKNGGNFDLTVKTAKGAMKAPVALPKGALKPSMKIKLGGADTGMVNVTGPANAEAIAQGADVSLSEMTGTYKPGKTGKVTLSPADMSIDVTMVAGSTPLNVPCKATSTGVSLELDTVAQAGGSGSPTTTTTTGNATSGNLAETGAEDEGGIKALALVAGTVILLGGAVFTFTPWRRLRGTR